MVLASAFGVSAFVLVSLVVGLRLIALSRRAHRLPGLSIGLAFLLSGCVGFPLLFAALALPGSLGASLSWVQASGLVSVDLGALALWVFTWRTFRPAERWATALVAGAGATLGVSFAMQAFGSGFAVPVRSGPWFWIAFATRALSLLWTAFEALRYHGLMQRRRRLGLAEPLLANRFLLWGVSALAGVAMSGLSGLTIAIAPAAEPGVVAALRLAGSGCGLVAAAATWLAFLPPAAYRRRFEAAPGVAGVS